MLDFNIETEESNSSPIITVTGEVDIYTTPKLHRILSDCITKKPKLIIADLTQVRYIDSTGLGIFAHAAEQFSKTSGKLFVLCKNPQIQKIFDVSGLTKRHLTVVSELSEIPS